MDAKYFIPIGLFLAALYSAYRGYRSSKSNSTQDLGPGKLADNTGNVSYFRTGGGVFSVIFFAVGIAVVIIMNAEK